MLCVIEVFGKIAIKGIMEKLLLSQQVFLLTHAPGNITYTRNVNLNTHEIRLRDICQYTKSKAAQIKFTRDTR